MRDVSPILCRRGGSFLVARTSLCAWLHCKPSFPEWGPSQLCTEPKVFPVIGCVQRVTDDHCSSMITQRLGASESNQCAIKSDPVVAIRLVCRARRSASIRRAECGSEPAGTRVPFDRHDDGTAMSGRSSRYRHSIDRSFGEARADPERKCSRRSTQKSRCEPGDSGVGWC